PAYTHAMGFSQNIPETPLYVGYASLLGPQGWNLELWLFASIILFAIAGGSVMAKFRRKTTALEKKLRQYHDDLKVARENEKFMSDITKHFNDYLFFHDMDANILDYNPAYQKESDYTRNDIKRMNIQDIVPDPYKGEVSGYLARIRENDFDSGYINVVNRHGEPLVLEYMASVIRDASGRAVGVRGISRNITERMEARKALRESERKYRDILDSIEDGYYEVDLQGNYRFFNTQFCRLLGCPCDELYGRSYKDIVHEDFQKVLFETYNYVYRTGKPIKTFDWKMVRKDGASFFVETSITLRRDEHGNPAGFQGILRDVTERIAAQKKGRELEDQLHHAQKMESIGTLAGGIAHDFNNILFPIIGYTELAMKGTPLCSKTYENLEKVLHSANRAKDLIAQILNFSRHSGKQDLLPVLIQPVVGETLKLLQTTVPANIEIRQDIRKETGKVLISPSRIHQVIMNLCTNAFQAMEDCKTGQMHVCLQEIEVADESSPAYGKVTPGPYIHLSVSDTGCGIEPDLAEKIFEPYFTTKSRGKGTGLGLSVSYGIVKNAGGTILVASEPGSGSRFDVYLPVADESDDELDEDFFSTPAPTGNERILLVDDEQRIVDLQHQVLESLGYHVTAMTGSIKAFELFSRRPEIFDLLLTDQTMPDMTGLELAEKMRRLRPDMPVILCTGYNDKATREKAAKARINALLQKPIAKSDLAVALRKILDND
ncbi:MAG: hybrid sensor histidine kinase/response regulator, partial [Thermodesulfobacteriota bacterium]